MPETGPDEPSPRRTLSRLRRDKKHTNESSTSLASSLSTGDDSVSGVNRLRHSMDTALDRVKDRTRKTIDKRAHTPEGESRRLSNLVPGSHKRREKRNSIHQDDRQLSVQSGDSGLPAEGNYELGSRSGSSLLGGGSGRSSLLTDEEPDEATASAGKPVRPSFSPHQSHVGYLTLTSPELNAQAAASAQAIESTSNSPNTAATTETQDIPSIVEHLDTEGDSAPPPSELGRSQSPAEKFKSAFSLPRKKSGGDTDSVKSGGLGALGDFIRSNPTSRRGSVNAPPDPSSSQTSLPSTIAAESSPGPVPSADRPQTPGKKKSDKHRINTEPPPSTPPNTVDTPQTLVTPPTPTDPHHNSGTFPKRDKQNPVVEKPASTARDTALGSISSIGRRRGHSTALPPSKLSSSLPAPLTPTVEEAKTPGGTLTQPTSATGFFSSVFSAAQKAADQLTNSINSSGGPNQKAKAAQEEAGEEGGEEVIPGPESGTDFSGIASEGSQPAVETLGRGDLSLSHLGISVPSQHSPMTSATDLAKPDEQSQHEGPASRTEEEAAMRAVSVAYEKPVQNTVSQAIGGRPQSVASMDRLTLAGERSPSRAGEHDVDSLKRAGSMRSKLSGRRRHRRSSATTATNGTSAIATGLSASMSGLANTPQSGSGHRLTGFAVASSRRNKDFHQLFRSVPEDDYLIEDYSAALQRDILLHGRLYVSEGHICFSSNILGWVTNLVISFEEVVTVEKKNTAVIFPNAIVIATLQARNTFASFVARDSTYDLLIGIWKLTHPNLKSSLNGVAIDEANGTGDKTEKADSLASDGASGTGSEDEVYDEDDEEDDTGSFTDAGNGSVVDSEVGDLSLSRKTSAVPINGTPQANGSAVMKGPEGADSAPAGPAAGSDFPGPATHPPTECSDGAEHYDRPLADTTIPAPLGKVYSLMWGPASSAFMRRWLVEDQKSRELEYPEDKTGLDNDHKTVTFSYIKPLNAPVGPKQTKCITSNTLETFDLEQAVTVRCSTQTPDVPSGGVFTTKTLYCLMWGPNNSTRMIANCTIEWTGKSWLKGPIEKGANDGQIQYVKDITAALKAAVSSKPTAKSAGGRRGKGKKKKGDALDESSAHPAREIAATKQQEAANWGLFEPARPFLEPITSMLNPWLIVIFLIGFMMAFYMMSPRFARTTGLGLPGSPTRLTAYEDLWRREESELWQWLEDRAGLDGVYGSSMPSGADSERLRQRQKVLAARGMEQKLLDDGMRDRAVDDAIRVTEERLEVLKEAVGRKKGKSEGGG
ncbi:hypothetical protein MBLNU230_g7906t1 [Neophaeotheca triangularis]